MLEHNLRSITTACKKNEVNAKLLFGFVDLMTSFPCIYLAYILPKDNAGNTLGVIEQALISCIRLFYAQKKVLL